MRFNLEAPLWAFLNTAVRFAALNLLFVVSIIPVVTIGPALAALYGTAFAYIDHDDISLWRNYLRRFRQEFRAGMISSAVFLAGILLAAFGWMYWGQVHSLLALGVGVVIGLVALVLIIVCEYYYPLQSRYDNGMRRTFALALRLPASAVWLTLALLAINLVSLTLMTMFPYARIFFLVMGCAWTAYAKALMFSRLFSRVAQAQGSPETSTEVAEAAASSTASASAQS